MRLDSKLGLNDAGGVPRRLDSNVSPHFKFRELVTTQHREFLTEQADPPDRILHNLTRLAHDFLEPARALVGPLRINSGYRCPALNDAIGGSKTSRHMDGLAADVYPLGMSLPEAFAILAGSAIPFDQIIFELGTWIHIGASPKGTEPRGQLLAMYSPGAYTIWDPSDPRFRTA